MSNPIIEPGDITALRYALFELCSESPSNTVQSYILGRILEEYNSGKRSFNDTVMVLSQFRRFEKIAPSTAQQIINFELHHSQMSGEDQNAMDALQKDMCSWLREVSV